MSSHRDSLRDIHKALKYKPLNRTWAKLEIVLGLLASGLSMAMMMWAVTRPDVLMIPISLGVGLFVLGGYLTHAGHRSHLYQSNNELCAFLWTEIKNLKQAESPISSAPINSD